MGSKRKKTEKQKDFKKAKLKVGKTAAKPDNYTDTSFKAKTISLPNQSIAKKLTSSGTTLEIDLTHQLSLTKHHSSSTRKEVLIYLQQHLPSNPSLYKQIINLITPMIHDSSLNVQTALISLFNACGEKQQGLLDLHVRSIILFILSAMTHIQPVIRNGSSKFLQVLVEYAPQSLVKSYFAKVMKSYFQLMNWTLVDDKKSMSLAITTGSAIGGSAKKARIGHLHVLQKFLKVAIFEDQSSKSSIDFSTVVTIHPQSYKYLLPTIPQPFAPLKLFINELPKSGASTNDGSFSLQDLDILSAEDLATRRKVMNDIFLKPMLHNLKPLVKEGGEVGKEAKSTISLLEEFKASLQDEMKI
jgi:pre-rRNA-processing protein IPI1